jgi:hypothetical protein
LRHVRNENARQRVNALCFIGDAFEESIDEVCAQAHLLPLPAFVFQEGDAPTVTAAFNEIARITGGARCSFDAGSAQRLSELLRSVATYATNGVQGLLAQQTEAAKLLLAQIKR